MLVRRVACMLASMSVLYMAHPADAQRWTRRPPTPAGNSKFVSQPDFNAAFREVLFCGGKGQPEDLSCGGEWRGLRWSLVNGSTGEIDAGGTTWRFSCRQDRIEIRETCLFTTGDLFSLFAPGGFSIYVNWGLKRFPRSEMIGRVDGQVAFRTPAETWTETQSASIIRRMLAGKTLRYRWYDWPDEAEHDGEIDLSNFKDVLALMEALRARFVSTAASGALEKGHRTR